MSEELLSALLDGECSPAETEAALAAIERSPALAARWSRMCLSRDALAGVALARPSVDFAAGVMAAIAAEAAADLPAEAGSKVVPFRRPAVVAAPAVQPQRAVARRRRWQPLAGLAAAASIAAVAVVGGRSLLNAPVGGGMAEATIASAKIVPVAVRSAPDADASVAQLDGEAARQLNDFMIEHANSRADAGMGGSLSYARMVTTVGYRPADGNR